MQNQFYRLFSLMLVLSMVLSACGSAATPAAAPEAAEPAPAAAEPAAAAPAAESAAPAQEAADSHESPMWTEMVAAGTLPPLDERLPKNPRVVEPLESIGQYGGTMRIPYGGSWSSRLYSFMGNENLVVWTPQWDDIIPNVAESWEVNEDSSEFVFHLREGMMWSDGELFTADDILFWYNDIASNTDINPVIPSWLIIAGEPVVVEKIDDYTVKFSFAAPYGLFLQRLATPDASSMLEYPEHYVKQFHGDYNTENLDELVEAASQPSWVELLQSKTGSRDNNGPGWTNLDLPVLYAWRVTEPPGGNSTRAVLERNPYYWKVDTEGNQLPYVDKLVWDFLDDPNVMMLRTLNGEVEFMNYYANSLQNKAVYFDAMVEGDFRFFDQVRDTANSLMLHLNLNTKNEVLREAFQNKDFRIALSYAINRQEVIDTVFVGQGIPYQGAPKPTSEYYNETLATQYTEYDVDQANQILDGIYPDKNADGIRLLPSGDPLQFDMILDATRFPDWVNVLELVQIYWKAVGVDMNIGGISGDLLEERRKANDYDATANFSDGGLATILNVGPFLSPLGRGSTYAPAWGAWYDLGDGAVEPQEPPDDVKRQHELYDMVKATADLDLQRQYMDEIIGIAIDRFWAIGISLDMGQYGVVKNNLHNVPLSMPESWNYPDPFPTNTSTYWLSQ